ncbi:AlbA family DNA-binding domain-containing protein [Chitinophaga sp. ARDCPP14]|uniref:AlbA family DNA-binding domain-containing protein n=1 Tax=Chitinophaga sp. ARDCPP14 TaxID=3391139 RepID=UPI003F51C99A
MIKKNEEFLKDISAFYNTEGGTIIFGLSERREGKKKLGIPILPDTDKLTIDDYEKEKSRISQIVLSGTNPKIVNLQFSDLLDIDGCRVFAIGIPKNISIPTMVIYNGSNTFHKRNYTDKYMPDTHELFRAFLSHHSLKEEVAAFIKSRTERIYEPFSEGLRNLPVVITHMVPSNFQDIIALDSFSTKEFKEFASKIFQPTGFAQKQQHGYSFEGLFLLQKDDPMNPQYMLRDKQRGHTLLLRNGCVESINNIFFNEIEEGAKYCTLYIRVLAEFLNNAVSNAFLYYQN